MADSPNFSGVALVDPSVGTQRNIAAFASPTSEGVPFGAFDGAWAVYTETLSQTDFGAWSLTAWDAQTGGLLTLASSAGTPAGAAAPTLLPDPVVRGAQASWTESDSNGESSVHVYDLTSQQDQVVYRGFASQPVFWGGNLLFTVASGNTRQLNHFVAVSAATGRRVALPQPLVEARGITYFGATPSAVIWSGANYRTVSLWEVGQARASQVTTIPLLDGEAEFYAESGGMFAWMSGQAGPFIVDPATHSYTQFPLALGYVAGSGTALLVSYGVAGASGKQSGLYPQAVNSILDLGRLAPLPSCSG